jgi:hypothetical protein
MKPSSIVKRTTSPFNGSKKVEAPEPAKSYPKAESSHSKAEATLQKIQEKAYELFLKRNGGPGSAEEDWAQAERIVKG